MPASVESGVWFVARKPCGCAVAAASDGPDVADFIYHHETYGYTVEKHDGPPTLGHCRCRKIKRSV